MGRVELLLEELMIDPCRTDRAGRRISIFLDVTAMDALGRLQTTTTKACLRRDCLPAAFCDTVLATVELGPFDDDVPRTVSFAVAAAEGTDDRLRELIEASRHYLRWDLDATREAGCAAPTGGILPQSRAALVASHTRAWLDCLLVWSGDVLPSLGKKAEARLGGEAQFTATIVGPELDYVYRNTSTGRLVEIIGSSRVRGRPMVQTFSSGDADLIGRFRMGFRTCLAAPALVAEKLPRALQEVGR
ncbi:MULTISPECIES: hypothetical protein [unclassified Leifsonia]|uniref:hypothetical protein n=1 Tax=unclassified Leifsonia TaxID=2663824 RepID=UPI00105D2363|nr:MULTISPECIES: hypothetical protein [unclassified Leifsonia]